jgi:drug/metabolite transporter (DMT)-like permease
MVTLLPAGLCILLFSWKRITRAVVQRGVLVGSSLCLALFTISIALKYTSAMSTAFFPSLNGFLAAIIAWLVLRQPVTKATWIAGVLSVVGTAMLVFDTTMDGVRGVLIAFLGGVFFTIYVFLSDSTHTGGEGHEELPALPLFGIELLTMAAWANLVVLLFGDWHDVHLVLPQDAMTVLYVAGACTFLPTLLTVVMQKHISPVTVSFIYILEPVFGAIIANVYLHETLPLYGYAGGTLVVLGAIVHTWGTARTARNAQPMPSVPVEQHTYTPQTTPAPAYAMVQMAQVAQVAQVAHVRGHVPQARRSDTSTQRRDDRTKFAPVLFAAVLSYPFILLGASIVLFGWLGGLPPVAWRVLYSIMQQGSRQNNYGLWPLTPELNVVLLQSLCWLVAWSALLIATYVAIRYASSMAFERNVMPRGHARQQYRQQDQVRYTAVRAGTRTSTPAMHNTPVSSQRQEPRREVTARRRVSREEIEEYETRPVPVSANRQAYRQSSKRLVG